MPCRRLRRRNQKDASIIAISATPPITPPAIAPTGAALPLASLDGIVEAEEIVVADVDINVDEGEEVGTLDVEEEVTTTLVSRILNRTQTCRHGRDGSLSAIWYHTRLHTLRLLHDSKRQRPIRQLLARIRAPVRGGATLVPPDLAGVTAKEPPVVEHDPRGVRAARRLHVLLGEVRVPGRIARHVVLLRANGARRAAGVKGRHGSTAIDFHCL